MFSKFLQNKGAVLANRLSANSKWKVLLIEAGGDEQLVNAVPALQDYTLRSKSDWNFTTKRQDFACQEYDGYCEFPQAKVLGGSSAVGDMIFMRGNAVDYDAWADLGGENWCFDAVLPYFKKVENMAVPELAKDTYYHSSNGPVPVSYASFNSSLLKGFVQASRNLGLKFTDYNGAQQIGVAYAVHNLRDGVRYSATKSYLEGCAKRFNLAIFKNTLVKKILFDETVPTRAIGVSCQTGKRSYNVFASKEIIVSAGVINTPKLLMLSGIGPRQHLEDLFLPVIADLPVGDNLIDLPVVPINYGTDSTEFNYNDTQWKQSVLEYIKQRTGILSAPRTQVLAVMNSSCPSRTDTLPDAIYFGEWNVPPLSRNVQQVALTIRVVSLDSKSTGTVRLASANFQDAPIIDPSYLCTDEDYENLISQILLADRIARTDSMSRYCQDLILPAQCKHITTMDRNLAECLAKYSSRGGYISSGTCRMGIHNDGNSVVDPQLKVHGISSLRVVDASIIPKPIRGTMLATQLMIAEKVSAMIRNEYSF